MKKLGIAIIGTGGICPAHLQSYLQFTDRCEVKALCDIYPDKAERTAAKVGLTDVRIIKDYHEIMNMQDIDLVSLCLPPSLHCQAAVDFLGAGKNVLCEKPMAASVEECDKMLAAQKKSGKLLAIISQNRFRTPVMKMKQLFDSGILGKVKFARVDSLWWRGTNYYDLWWRGTWEKEGGGCTINHAVHQIDILQWMIGVPTSVSSFIQNIAHPNSEVEDISISVLQYPGMMGEINACLETHDERQEFFFDTTEASVSIPWKVTSVKQLENGFFEPNPEKAAYIQAQYDKLPVLPIEGHAAEILNVLKTLNGEEQLLVSGTEGKRAVELISAIYKSATEQRAVTLPITKNDPFYSRNTMLPLLPRFYKKGKSVENFSDSNISLGHIEK